MDDVMCSCCAGVAATRLTRAAIRHTHPTWTEQEVRLELLRVAASGDLADRVRANLTARR
jgi:hypothetical protein